VAFTRPIFTRKCNFTYAQNKSEAFPATDFRENHKLPTSRASLLRRISPKSNKTCGKYGRSFIQAYTQSMNFTAPNFHETGNSSIISCVASHVPNFMQIGQKKLCETGHDFVYARQ